MCFVNNCLNILSFIFSSLAITSTAYFPYYCEELFLSLATYPNSFTSSALLLLETKLLTVWNNFFQMYKSRTSSKRELFVCVEQCDIILYYLVKGNQVHFICLSVRIKNTQSKRRLSVVCLLCNQAEETLNSRYQPNCTQLEKERAKRPISCRKLYGKCQQSDMSSA